MILFRLYFYLGVHSGHHSWVTGKLSCKSRTKNDWKTVKVCLERYEREWHVHKPKSEIWFKMGDWGEIVTFSLFGCKKTEMAITLAGMLSKDQKMSISKGN